MAELKGANGVLGGGGGEAVNLIQVNSFSLVLAAAAAFRDVSFFPEVQKSKK